MSTATRVRAHYQQQNERAARVILADVQWYGGDESLMVEWARVIVAKAQPTVTGPLFQQGTHRRRNEETRNEAQRPAKAADEAEGIQDPFRAAAGQAAEQGRKWRDVRAGG